MTKVKHQLSICCLILFTSNYAQAQNIYLDIPYTNSKEYKQQLDLYVPKSSDYATILFVHGGSLISGDRKDEPFAKMAAVFQEQGIATALVSYRLAPEYKWPAQPNDVVAAFDWLKKKLPAYGGNKNKIYLFGHSSGCLLVSLVGTDKSYLADKGYELEDIAGMIPMGCRLQDEILITHEKPENYETYYVPPEHVNKFHQTDMADVYTSLDQKNDAVPVKHITAELPRTLILIAENERFYPPILRDASEFVGRALELNADADLEIVEGRTHMTAINNMTSADDKVVQRVMRFIREKS